MYWKNTVTEYQSEAEERPICGLQTTQPCCAQVRKSCLSLLKKVKEASISQNILLNTQKTKIMVVDKNRESKEDLVLDGEKIEVQRFVYLGSLINIKGSSAQEIRRRLAMVGEQCRTWCLYGRAEV